MWDTERLLATMRALDSLVSQTCTQKAQGEVVMLQLLSERDLVQQEKAELIGAGPSHVDGRMC